MDRSIFYGAHIPMTENDYTRAADMLRVEVPVIQAVAKVETNGSPFLPDGRPDILYEAHLFGRWTKNRFAGVRDTKGKAISATSWDRSLYGAAGAWQYTRLGRAMDCDESAAIKSASWGAFQILGQEAGPAGFKDLESFVRAMAHSAGDHLTAFCNYVLTNKLDDELRSQDWKNFARQYNGPAYAKNQYDTKMATAHRQLAASWAAKRISTKPDLAPPPQPVPTQPAPMYPRETVAKVQAALTIVPEIAVNLKVDGWMGPKTEAAIKMYEQFAHLPIDGKIDADLLVSLGIQNV